jgi:hypothetical protein
MAAERTALQRELSVSWRVLHHVIGAIYVTPHMVSAWPEPVAEGADVPEIRVEEMLSALADAGPTCGGRLRRNPRGYWRECRWSNVWRPQHERAGDTQESLSNLWFSNSARGLNRQARIVRACMLSTFGRP